MAKDKIVDNDLYEIEHPRTGAVVVWKGQRIKAYQIVNRCEVEFASKPKKKSTKKATSKKAETTEAKEVEESNSEQIKEI